jgi:hypothetical protein
VSGNATLKKLESIPLGEKVRASDTTSRYAKIKVMESICILEVMVSELPVW